MLYISTLPPAPSFSSAVSDFMPFPNRPLSASGACVETSGVQLRVTCAVGSVGGESSLIF